MNFIFSKLFHTRRQKNTEVDKKNLSTCIRTSTTTTTTTTTIPTKVSELTKLKMYNTNTKDMDNNYNMIVEYEKDFYYDPCDEPFEIITNNDPELLDCYDDDDGYVNFSGHQTELKTPSHAPAAAPHAPRPSSNNKFNLFSSIKSYMSFSTIFAYIMNTFLGTFSSNAPMKRSITKTTIKIPTTITPIPLYDVNESIIDNSIITSDRRDSMNRNVLSIMGLMIGAGGQIQTIKRNLTIIFNDEQQQQQQQQLHHQQNPTMTNRKNITIRWTNPKLLPNLILLPSNNHNNIVLNNKIKLNPDHQSTNQDFHHHPETDENLFKISSSPVHNNINLDMYFNMISLNNNKLLIEKTKLRRPIKQICINQLFYFNNTDNYRPKIYYFDDESKIVTEPKEVTEEEEEEEQEIKSHSNHLEIDFKICTPPTKILPMILPAPKVISPILPSSPSSPPKHNKTTIKMCTATTLPSSSPSPSPSQSPPPVIQPIEANCLTKKCFKSFINAISPTKKLQSTTFIPKSILKRCTSTRRTTSYNYYDSDSDVYVAQCAPPPPPHRYDDTLQYKEMTTSQLSTKLTTNKPTTTMATTRPSRERQISECSDDFICFERSTTGDDDDENQFSDMECDYEDSSDDDDDDDDDDENDEDSDSDNDNDNCSENSDIESDRHMEDDCEKEEINNCDGSADITNNLNQLKIIGCEEEQFDSGFTEKKVQFNLIPKIHKMITWSYAYKASRCGPWEQHARDRFRFGNRIHCSIGPILNPILHKDHRQKVYMERFNESIPN